MNNLLSFSCKPVLIAIAIGFSVLLKKCGFGAELQTAPSATRQEDPKTYYILAIRYSKGDGVSFDSTNAAVYMRRAADAGYAYAQTDLGSYYGRGFGVNKDFQEAVKWYRRAATNSDALGEYCLGSCLVEGRGVAQNLDEGISWWRKSADSGLAEAQTALGNLSMGRGSINDTKYINYSNAVLWLRKAAEQGYIPAMNNLGFLYQYGQGVAKSDAEALKWYCMAAQNGDPKAQANLGILYQEGMGVPINLVEACKWFILSAQQKDPVGKHQYDDFMKHHLLSTNEMAEARKRANEFRSEQSKVKVEGSRAFQQKL